MALCQAPGHMPFITLPVTIPPERRVGIRAVRYDYSILPISNHKARHHPLEYTVILLLNSSAVTLVNTPPSASQFLAEEE
jgi:hypothetical protein